MNIIIEDVILGVGSVPLMNSKMSNLQLRLYSAIVIGVTFIYIIIGPKWLFNMIMSIVGVGMMYEWFHITKSYIFHLLIGIIVIGAAISSLLIMKNLSNYLLLWYFTSIWSVDSCAMLGGKLIRGPKLAPYISPNKTWSGLITGVLAAMVIICTLDLFIDFSAHFTGYIRAIGICFSTLFLGIVAQISDLFESYFKRYHDVKDSGTIIPGHGGILDRFDSTLLTAPIILFFILKY